MLLWTSGGGLGAWNPETEVSWEPPLGAGILTWLLEVSTEAETSPQRPQVGGAGVREEQGGCGPDLQQSVSGL